MDSLISVDIYCVHISSVDFGRDLQPVLFVYKFFNIWLFLSLFVFLVEPLFGYVVRFCRKENSNLAEKFYSFKNSCGSFICNGFKCCVVFTYATVVFRQLLIKKTI